MALHKHPKRWSWTLTLDLQVSAGPPRRVTHSALWTATAASKQPAQYEETGHTWKTDALAARWPRNPGVRITLALSSCNGNGEEGATCYQNKSASADWGDRAEIRVYFFNPHLSIFVFFFFLSFPFKKIPVTMLRQQMPYFTFCYITDS